MATSVDYNDFVIEIGRECKPSTLAWHDQRRLLGELCRVSVSSNSIDITTDTGGLFAIFGDLKTGVLSSSLRAVISGSDRKYSLNSDAICEQLVTGAIAGRETCFLGIERLDGCGMSSIGATRISFRKFDRGAPAPLPTFRDPRACVDYQLEVLRSRFKEIGGLAADRGISMGLSGGYDSRLMLLLALEAGIPVHPFTFSSGHHVEECSVASAVAQRAGLELREIPLRAMEELSPSALAANIDDAIAYYDGRTNKTMGTFSDVHTGRIQRRCLGDAAININGLGGELYRNRERLPHYAFSFRDWLSHYVIGPTGGDVFKSERARRYFEKRLAQKYGDLLDLGKLDKFNRCLARRWYRDVWLPYFAGPRLSAENRVGPALMPFADGAVSGAALAATPFIGPHGELEAALIRRLNEKIAALPSTYGPGFSISPMKRRLCDMALALVPLKARLARHRLRPRSGRSTDIIQCRERFSEPIRFLNEMKLPLNIDSLLRDQVSRDRTLYIAEFLYRCRQSVDNVHI